MCYESTKASSTLLASSTTPSETNSCFCFKRPDNFYISHVTIQQTGKLQEEVWHDCGETIAIDAITLCECATMTVPCRIGNSKNHRQITHSSRSYTITADSSMPAGVATVIWRWCYCYAIAVATQIIVAAGDFYNLDYAFFMPQSFDNRISPTSCGIATAFLRIIACFLYSYVTFVCYEYVCTSMYVPFWVGGTLSWQLDWKVVQFPLRSITSSPLQLSAGIRTLVLHLCMHFVSIIVLYLYVSFVVHTLSPDRCD